MDLRKYQFFIFTIQNGEPDTLQSDDLICAV